MSEERFEFAGYSFKNEEELELAKKEAAGIKHINQKINYDDPESLLSVYNKLLERDLFKTVVGIDFLRNLRKILLEQYNYSISELKSVPVSLDSVSPEEIKVKNEIKRSVNKKNKVEKSSREKKRKNESEKVEKDVVVVGKSFKKPFVISIVVTVCLVIVLLLTIRICTDSENINILNYQDRLERQYQSWENDLTERERVLNEKSLLK